MAKSGAGEPTACERRDPSEEPLASPLGELPAPRSIKIIVRRIHQEWREEGLGVCQHRSESHLPHVPIIVSSPSSEEKIKKLMSAVRRRLTETAISRETEIITQVFDGLGREPLEQSFQVPFEVLTPPKGGTTFVVNQFLKDSLRPILEKAFQGEYNHN